MKTHSFFHFLLIAVIAGAIAGAGTTYLLGVERLKNTDRLIEEFYAIENAVYVSPHGIRKQMGEPKVLLVDLRSQEEYETAHVIGAVNIPAYKDPNTSAYGDVERIVGSFKELIKENPNKDVVVYCYSMPCMTGRKIGLMLSEHDIYVKHLGIGWSEWRYYWNLWNHDGEKKVNPTDYIATGKEPGVFIGEGGEACPLGGDFGC
ncbi:MAG: rhodanese-like domain-containing protein [bacterium]|nr:rhodanese-like domain-containing protein [bacterium]